MRWSFNLGPHIIVSGIVGLQPLQNFISQDLIINFSVYFFTRFEKITRHIFSIRGNNSKNNDLSRVFDFEDAFYFRMCLSNIPIFTMV